MILEIIIIIIIINTDLNKGLTRIYQLTAVYAVPPGLSAIGIIPNKLHRSLELLSSPWLYILMHSAVILSTCHIIRKIFGSTVNKKCLVSKTSAA